MRFRVAAVAAAAALLLSHFLVADGARLRNLGRLDAVLDIDIAASDDSLPSVTPLKLAWNGAAPALITHYAPNLVSEDQSQQAVQSYFGIFQDSVSAGYALPKRPGVVAQWQPGKHLFLAWYLKTNKLIDVLSQAKGFGRLAGVSALPVVGRRRFGLL